MRCSASVLIGVLSLTLLTAGGRSGIAQTINREQEIKVAYLYQFAKYVEWPKNAVPDDDQFFVIGVLGKDPFGGHLDRLAETKTVQDRKIVLRRFDSAKDYQPCHILFISALPVPTSEEKTADQRLKAAVEKTKGTPVLLVGDTPGFAEKGVVINFLVDAQENRIKLEINRDAERRAGLKISAQLLALERSGVVRILKAD